MKQLEYDNLKQLDRIEYILRLNRLEKNFNPGLFYGYLYPFILTIFGILNFALLLYIAFGLFSGFIILDTYLKMSIIVMTLLAIGDIITLYFRKKYKKKLDVNFLERKK